MASALYRDMIEWNERNSSPETLALNVEVWGGTPWMVEIFTGSISDPREREIREWCHEQFGPEAWPLHGRPGRWHRGSATVHGWTWFGFDTEQAMNDLASHWPAPP